MLLHRPKYPNDCQIALLISDFTENPKYNVRKPNNRLSKFGLSKFYLLEMSCNCISKIEFNQCQQGCK